MKPVPGNYVEFHRRTKTWPYYEPVFGIVVGSPKAGVRVRTINVKPETTHVVKEASVRAVSFHEAHGQPEPYRCGCGRTSPGGCDAMHGACIWNPPR